ncbi:hypothetical protein HNY73_005245 [Argiope bruennichi]|uniref:Uncharacterized protein n=1 Tax=Argiope bruennichi TaxID=94029 RepID=A0A8T0FN29_ARGBR|nr:hypothetical protein HNY73_005245 [Argiope bruennichi]
MMTQGRQLNMFGKGRFFRMLESGRITNRNRSNSECFSVCDLKTGKDFKVLEILTVQYQVKSHNRSARSMSGLILTSYLWMITRLVTEDVIIDQAPRARVEPDQRLFETKNILRIPWSARSSDLNPIDSGASKFVLELKRGLELCKPTNYLERHSKLGESLCSVPGCQR